FIRFFLKNLLKILNIKAVEKGSEHLSNRNKLFVSNHTSYLDIFILGAMLETRFTPKIELSKWLFINYIVKLSLPLYIHRTAQKSLEQKKKIKNAILNGDNIVVFPEATTNNGRKLLPFKSSLFSVAEPEFEDDLIEQIPIQPISIIYKEFDGEKVTEKNIDKIAWHGDMTFIPHLWNVFKSKNIIVEIIYHQEIYFESFTDRKTLAKHCHEVIEGALN
ncbi:MAG TPA: hypothetical protein DIV86_00965, partial [Alphaproteobacteria bacterium]|nr:hypothetical protein [Alphaproteobacteria bacterium]